MKNEQSAKIILFICFVFSGYYVNILPFHPVYFFSIVGFLGFILNAILHKHVKYDSLSIYSILLMFYFILFFTLSHKSDNSFGVLINILLSLSMFFVARRVLPYITSNQIHSISVSFVLVSIPLLFFESFYRITNPVDMPYLLPGLDESLAIYSYKFNSIMFQDSNFVALFILVLLFFWVYINRFSGKGKLVALVLVALLLLTLSRAAALTVFVFFMLYFFRGRFYKVRKLLYFVLIPLSLIAFNYLRSFSYLDGSFSSKFYIVDLFLSYLSSASFNELVFGVGFGNAVNYLGIGAHNIFVFYFVEVGIVGFFLLFRLWWLVLIKSKYKAGAVVFPFVLAGLSLTSTSVPYLYIIFAIIVELESREYDYARI